MKYSIIFVIQSRFYNGLNMEVCSFEATEECLGKVRDFMASWAAKNGISVKTSNKLAVVADEIVSNIVHYSSASVLDICCEVQGTESVIKFQDDGRAFNPLVETVEPDVSANVESRKIGGLGVFLVKKMAQSVSYENENGKNILTVVLSNV